MISVFSLVRTAFLSSYNNILLIFSLASIAFLSIYKNIVRLLAWHSKFKNRKALEKKISEELMPIQWHPKRWRKFCISEDEKKEIEQIFTECASA